MSRRSRIIVLAAATIVLVGLGVVGLIQARDGAGRAASSYQREKQQLEREFENARAEGYMAQDLAVTTSRLQQVDRKAEPLLMVSREGFYNGQSATVAQLRGQFQGHLARTRADAKVAAGTQIETAKQALDRDQQIGVPEADLQPLRDQLSGLDRQQAGARDIRGIRGVIGSARQLTDAAKQIGAAQEQESRALEQAAVDLKAKAQGNVEALRGPAREQIASARNDATVATWSKAAGFERAYQQLERLVPLVDSPEIDKVALGAAAAQRYSAQVHDAMLKGMPNKAILLSISGQQLWAYEGGRVVQDTLVTTGRPPDLATDVGPMKVLRRNSPWQMKSPWPQGSPYYYPPAWVQMVVWFTVTGEGFHDASWQNTPYGSGSQYGPSASHGCVHVQLDAERFLYSWSDEGTPVIVFPGDGSPLADQLKQRTVDDNGVPSSAT